MNVSSVWPEDGFVNVVLQYFDGCPNWQMTHTRLLEALRAAGHGDHLVVLQSVSTPEQAQQWGFRGSPTLLINGLDPFAAVDAPFGLSCRMFATPDGLAGAPTVEQIVGALAGSADGEA